MFALTQTLALYKPSRFPLTQDLGELVRLNDVPGALRLRQRRFLLVCPWWLPWLPSYSSTLFLLTPLGTMVDSFLYLHGGFLGFLLTPLQQQK